MRRWLAFLALALLATSAAAQSTSPLDTALRFLDAGRLEDAEREIRGLLETVDAPPVGHLLGVVLERQGRFDEAERQYGSVAERFGSVRSLLDLARLHARRQDLEGAAAALAKALEIAPNSEEVLSAYARLSLASRSPVPAIIALEPLVRMHPDVAEYAYLLGVARMQLGDMPGALEHLEIAGRLEPQRALTMIATGLALNNVKRYAEAKAALLGGLKLEPGNLEGVAALAEAEEGLGELDAAEEHARRVLGAEPEHVTANLAMGMVLMKRASYEEAKEALVKAVEADPSSPKAHYQLSLAYARLGDRESSKKHLELYRQALEDRETSMAELRNKAGIPGRGGM